MSERKILPCPFCAGEVKLDDDEFYMFCCDKCGAGITFAKELEDGTATDCNKDESVDKWNTRKPIENVVEQLENMSNDIPLQYENNYEQGVSDGLDKAIEIVKKGRVDDVCEWQKYDYKTICSPHERDWSIPAMKDFKWCPYCGKKIKVVE